MEMLKEKQKQHDPLATKKILLETFHFPLKNAAKDAWKVEISIWVNLNEWK